MPSVARVQVVPRLRVRWKQWLPNPCSGDRLACPAGGNTGVCAALRTVWRRV